MEDGSYERLAGLVERWLSETTVGDPHSAVSSLRYYQEWTLWKEGKGIPPVSMNALSRELRAAGLTPIKVPGGGRAWVGRRFPI